MAGVRYQTKDELIENLKDQCKFWRTMWSKQVDCMLELEAQKNDMTAALESYYDTLKKIREDTELDEN